MAMRVQIEFTQPLSREQRTDVLVAMAGLAKSERIRFAKDGYQAEIFGEAMSCDHVRKALQTVGIAVSTARSSLIDEEDSAVDEPDVSSATERFRPIGR